MQAILKIIANVNIPVNYPVWFVSRLILTAAALMVLYFAISTTFTSSNAILLVMAIAAIVLGWRK